MMNVFTENGFFIEKPVNWFALKKTIDSDV